MRYILGVTAFIEGAVVMILELAGSRIVAPYLGTSIIIWTSLIGVILASLSVGYYFGGRWADKNPDPIRLSRIILTASILIALIVFFKPVLMMVNPGSFFELLASSVILTLILFSPPTIALGMVTPFIAKILITSTETSGRTIGTLYAISTTGSIVGTFLGGFVLISFVGSTKILLLLSLTLFIVSTVIYVVNRKKIHTIGASLALFIIFISAFFTNPLLFNRTGALVADKDTQYSRIWIYDSFDPMTNLPVRYMTDNLHSIQSGIFKDNPDTLLFEYLKLFDLAVHFRPGFDRALMIGAGMYSYPKHFVKTYPKATLDIAEIDPMLKNLAEKYFSYTDHPSVTVFHEDGRNFLNRTTNMYNVIFIDAFRSEFSIPFQLTTYEAVQKMYDRLDENGIVIANVISGVDGFRGGLLHSMVKTYQSVFLDVRVLKVYPHIQNELTQNVIIVASKKENPSLSSNNLQMKNYLSRMVNFSVDPSAIILTDDYAPVERLMARLLI